MGMSTDLHRVTKIDFSANELDGGTTVINITATEDGNGEHKKHEHTFFVWGKVTRPELTFDEHSSADKGLAASILGHYSDEDLKDQYDEGYAMGREDAQPDASTTASAISQCVFNLRGAITDALGDIECGHVDHHKLEIISSHMKSPRWEAGAGSCARFLAAHGINDWLVGELDLCALYDAIARGSWRIHQAPSPAAAWEQLALMLCDIINE